MASSPSSGSDRDDAFDADMEALRRACMLTGAHPADVGGACSVSDADSDADADSDSDSDSDSSPGSSGSDDLGLLRRLQERFSSLSPAVDSLPFVTPLSTLPPPGSDNEDDFETLRAIQRRFTQYESDSLRKKSEKILEEPEILVNGETCGPQTPNRSAELNKKHDHSYTESHFLEHEACNSNVRDLMSSKFPKSAQNFVDALKKNRSCQKFIRRKLIEIEAKIEKNKELKERIKCLLDFQVARKRKVANVLCQKKDPRVTLISVKNPTSEKSSKTTSKKIPALCFGPGENSQVSKYRMVLRRFPVSLSKQPWSKIEKENLTKGIKQQYQEMLILNSMNMECDTEGITDSNLMSAITLSDLEFTPEKIRNFIPLVNWDRLVSMYVIGRSGAECEARWLNCEDPMIDHNPWTVLEDKKLLFILQERGIYNWIDISVALGTHRTPFQCLLRYQRSLNPHILNKDWTEEEDAKLHEAVENYGDNNWQIVASCLEGRTGTQCSNRWKKTLNPERKKVGRWSVDEDRQLKVAVMLFGAKNWSKIAWFAPGRTQVQCRERWLNCLDPALNLKPWTAAEDAKLLDAIAVHGNCWSKIAACIPPRTDNQCRRRWKILLPGEAILLQAAAQIKKTALISNFVDRESERPAIGPNDFTPLINSTTVEKIDGAKVRKQKLSGNQPKKSRSKPRRVLTENSKEDHVINSCTDLVPADLALLPSIESNSTESSGISRSKNKRSSDNRPRKSRVKSRRHLNKNSTEDCMRDTSADIAPADMSLVTDVYLNATGSMGNGKTMDKTLSENQQNSRIKSRVLVEENSTADATTNSSVDIAPDDLPLVLYMNTTSNGTIKRKTNIERDNILKKSRDKSMSPCQENLIGDGTLNCSADMVSADFFCTPAISHNSGNEIIKRIRKKKSRPMDDNQPQISKAEAERSLKENFTAHCMVNASTELVPADHLVLGANASTSAAESMRNPSKKTKRNRQPTKSGIQDTIAGGSVSDSLMVSGKDSSAVMASQRMTNTGASLVKCRDPGANDQRDNFCEKLISKKKMQFEETSRAMYGGDDVDDSSLLATFYEKAKRKRKCIGTEGNTLAAKDSSKMRAMHADDDSSLLATFYKKAKIERKVTEAQAARG